MDSYKNLFRSASFVERVEQLQKETLLEKNEASILLTSNESFFNKQILEAEKKEQYLFSLLGLQNEKDPLKSLNKRLQEYQQETINLSGTGLFKTFILPIEEKGDKDLALLERAAMELLEEYTKENIEKKEVDELLGKFIQRLVTKELLSSSGLGKSRYSSIQGYGHYLGGNIDNFNISDYVKFFELTPEQRKAIEKKIEQKAKEDFKKNPDMMTAARVYIEQKESDTKITTWFTYTNEKTASAVGKNETNNTNLKIKDFILNNSGVSIKNRPILEKAIDHVLSKNKKAFFVGKNEKEITGILGEIQSLFYLYLLVSEEIAEIIWKGGTYSGKNNTKPHQDIVLSNLGIQVKNTTKNLFNDNDFLVNFKNVKLDKFLDFLELQNTNVRQVFENYFGTYNFNVPYQKKEDNYIETKKADESLDAGQQFNTAREILDTSLQTDIDKLLSLFAASLMYLSVKETTEEDKNTLFFLGGVSAITVATILKEIRDNFQKQGKSDFMVNSYQKKSGQNIVGVLQGGLLQEKKENLEKTNIRSENILSTIFISTRYNFQNLITKYR